MLKERAIRIGKPVPLAAVVTEPAAFDPRRPAVLLLNSGVMHHVGSCRMSVKLARAMAGRGLLALRFDFAGIGDSEPRGGTLAAGEAALAQLEEVMDYLRRTRGVERFILYGLCSGAMTSFRMACRDERVVGIVQIDGYCYRTWRYHYEYYRPRLLRKERWVSALGRLLGRRRQAAAATGVDDAFLEVPTFDQPPAQEVVAAGLRQLVERGVRMYACFTGGEANYNYAGQYRDSFRSVDFRGLLREEYYPQTNHIITQPDQQRLVIDSIVSWVAAAADELIKAPIKESIKNVA